MYILTEFILKYKLEIFDIYVILILRKEHTMKAKFEPGQVAIHKDREVVIGKDAYVNERGQTYYYARPIVSKKAGTFVRSDYLTPA